MPVKGTDTVMAEEPAADRCRLSVIVPVFNMASEDRLSFCMGSLLQPAFVLRIHIGGDLVRNDDGRIL